MVVESTSETSVSIYQATVRNISESSQLVHDKLYFQKLDLCFRSA
jgi:hypothetical protein